MAKNLQQLAYESGKGNLFEQYNAGQMSEAALRRALSGGGGGSSPQISFDPNAFSREQDAKRSQFNQALRGEENRLINTFKTEYPQILSALEQQLELPRLRKTAFQTGQMLEQAPEEVTQGTQGFDVNQNQLDRMIAAEVTKRAPIAQKATSQAQFVESEFGRQAQQKLAPYEAEINLAKDRFAREYSGFSQDAENLLNALLAKLQAGVSLSIAERQQATRLAELEQQKEQFNKAMEQGAYEIVDLGDRKALIDPFTGKEISSYSKGLAPTKGEAPFNPAKYYLSGGSQLNTLSPTSQYGMSTEKGPIYFL